MIDKISDDKGKGKTAMVSNSERVNSKGSSIGVFQSSMRHCLDTTGKTKCIQDQWIEGSSKFTLISLYFDLI